MRIRRSVATWIFMLSAFLFIFLRSNVAFVSALSVIALLGIATGETPVEEE